MLLVILLTFTFLFVFGFSLGYAIGVIKSYDHAIPSAYKENNESLFPVSRNRAARVVDPSDPLDIDLN